MDKDSTWGSVMHPVGYLIGVPGVYSNKDFIVLEAQRLGDELIDRPIYRAVEGPVWGSVWSSAMEATTYE